MTQVSRSQAVSQTCPLRAFISYSHKDQEFRQQLETHLSSLKREGLLQIWSDRQIDAGEAWRSTLLSRLETAEIILLLISPDFLASDFCYDIELRRAMERQRAGGACVIPIFLRPCDCSRAWFAELQGVPDAARPVSTWKDRDEAFAEIARTIRKMAETMQSSRLPTSVAPPRAEPERGADLSIVRDAPFAPEMIVLPAGIFMMGSADDDDQAFDCERPQHPVWIGYRLAVSRYPVTFEDWDACLTQGGTTYCPDDQGWGRERRPVIHVSWEDTQQYLGWLTRRTGHIYRLLSEAEWEYAARAGTGTRYWWGDDITAKQANYDAAGREETTVVGLHEANPFRLCDMIGNVWEWTEDCWNRSYAGAPADGSAWTVGDCSHRVLRGGSWVNDPRNIRCASRGRYLSKKRDSNVGFRVARSC